MKFFVVLATILAAATAAPQLTITPKGYGPTSFVRAPAHDSASIEHHRLGGNFAYSTAEAHAFQSITPEISVATHPVAETTHVHQPAAIKTVHPAPIVSTHHAASPVFGQQDIFAQEPVIGTVAAHTKIHQQVYKQQHVTVQQPTVTVAQAAPVVTYAEAAPVAAPIGYAQAAPIGYAEAAPIGYAEATIGQALPAAAYGIGAPAIWA